MLGIRLGNGECHNKETTMGGNAMVRRKIENLRFGSTTNELVRKFTHIFWACTKTIGLRKLQQRTEIEQNIS